MRKRAITKKEINRIVNIGKGKGFLTYDEVNNLLPEELLPVDDWENLVLDVAASRIDRPETTARLRELIRGPKRKR